MDDWDGLEGVVGRIMIEVMDGERGYWWGWVIFSSQGSSVTVSLLYRKALKYNRLGNSMSLVA